MVQKSRTGPESSPRRGRPRAVDPATALARAVDAFWDAGFAATSLDDLTEATGMNRPSLYGAFGDKQALYRKAFDLYRGRTSAAIAAAVSRDQPLRAALRAIYDTAIAIYLSGDSGPRGCFIIGTAVAQAVTDPDVRAALADTLREIDDAFRVRISRAQRSGDLAAGADPAKLAKLAAATLYSLTIHARAGVGRAALDAIADAAVDVICGPAKGGRRRGFRGPD
jgi:TetR/AcrR family transcriptional regulator, copper-responsive repressor